MTWFSTQKTLKMPPKIIRANQWNSKVTWYKINAQKSLSFLCNNNETSEIEIKEIIPFTITIKRIKYLGINLHKATKDRYVENCKTLMKEIKDDTNNGEIFCDLGLEQSI